MKIKYSLASSSEEITNIGTANNSIYINNIYDDYLWKWVNQEKNYANIQKTALKGQLIAVKRNNKNNIIATNQQIIDVFDTNGERNNYKNLLKPFTHNIKDVMYRDEDQSIIFATNSQIHKIDNTGKLEEILSFQGKNIRSFEIINDSTCLIGTSKGLFINNTHLLDTLNVNKVLKYKDEYIMLSDKGVYSFALDGKDKYISRKRIHDEVFRKGFIDDDCLYLYNNKYLSVYDLQHKKYKNGILSSDWNKDLYFNDITTIKDYIAFGTSQGLYTLPKNIIEIPTIIPSLHLFINGAKMQKGLIEYQYQRNTAYNIELDIINMRSEPYHIAYKIKKDNNHYVSSRTNSDNKILLSSLSPGMYDISFTIKNKVNNQVHQKKIMLHILPLWYQTSDFMYGSILFAILLIALIINFIVNKYIAINNKKAEIKEKINKLSIRSKLNQLRPHFLFNIISPIQYYILDGDKNEGIVYLNSFSKLMRNSLEIFDQDTISIQDEIIFLENYLKLQQLRLDNKFDYLINTNNILNLDRIRIPTMIVQPIVENSVEHGVKKLEKQGLVEINFNITGNFLIISVQDNGKGLSNINYLKQGHALSILQEKIDLIYLKERKASIHMYQNEIGFITIINIPINI